MCRRDLAPRRSESAVACCGAGLFDGEPYATASATRSLRFRLPDGLGDRRRQRLAARQCAWRRFEIPEGGRVDAQHRPQGHGRRYRDFIKRIAAEDEANANQGDSNDGAPPSESSSGKGDADVDVAAEASGAEVAPCKVTAEEGTTEGERRPPATMTGHLRQTTTRASLA